MFNHYFLSLRRIQCLRVYYLMGSLNTFVVIRKWYPSTKFCWLVLLFQYSVKLFVRFYKTSNHDLPLEFSDCFEILYEVSYFLQNIPEISIVYSRYFPQKLNWGTILRIFIMTEHWRSLHRKHFSESDLFTPKRSFDEDMTCKISFRKGKVDVEWNLNSTIGMLQEISW